MTTNRISRRVLLGGAALGAGGMLVAPTATRAQSPKLLRLRAENELQVLDPAFRFSSSDADVISAIFAGLVRRRVGNEWGWDTDGAVSVEQVDPTHVRFQLKPGMPWSGGFGEVTADDVKFSYERMADPAMKAAYFTDWSALDRVDVIDSHAGVIVFKQPFAPFWASTLPAASGAILCRKAVEPLEGKRFTTAPPAISGPYRIKSFEPKRSVTLERNPLWPFSRPAYDEIQYVSIPDANAAETAYQAGEMDFVNLPLSSVGRLKQNTPRGSRLDIRPSLAYIWLGMQSEAGVLSDIRLRRAVQYAVDVDAVLEGAFFGVPERATGFIAPGLIGHRPANKIPGPDYDRARALLKEAGMPGGFKTNIRIPNSTEFVSSAQIIAASLGTVGIEAEVIPMERVAMKAMADDANGAWKQMGLMMSRFTMQPDPSWGTAWFVAKQIGVWNFERFSSPEYDQLEAAAKLELDNARRDAMYVRMQDLLEESGSYVFITHGANAAIHRDTVKPGLAPDGQYKFLRDFAPA
jgi:peptide/nickel transport system substrate-binding protein